MTIRLGCYIAVAAALGVAVRTTPARADGACTYSGSYYSPTNWNTLCDASGTIPLGCPIYVLAPTGVIDATTTATVVSRGDADVTLASTTMLIDSVTEQMATVDVYSCDCAPEIVPVAFQRFALTLTGAQVGDVVDFSTIDGDPQQAMTYVDVAGPCPAPDWPTEFSQATACDHCPPQDPPPSPSIGCATTGTATTDARDAATAMLLIVGLLAIGRRRRG